MKAAVAGSGLIFPTFLNQFRSHPRLRWHGGYIVLLCGALFARQGQAQTSPAGEILSAATHNYKTIEQFYAEMRVQKGNTLRVRHNFTRPDQVRVEVEDSANGSWVEVPLPNPDSQGRIDEALLWPEPRSPFMPERLLENFRWTVSRMPDGRFLLTGFLIGTPSEAKNMEVEVSADKAMILRLATFDAQGETVREITMAGRLIAGDLSFPRKITDSWFTAAGAVTTQTEFLQVKLNGIEAR